MFVFVLIQHIIRATLGYLENEYVEMRPQVRFLGYIRILYIHNIMIILYVRSHVLPRI